VKGHIKDYGHYGPHSANERPRRPEKALYIGPPITAIFEEWTLWSNGEQQENPRTRRSIQSCEFDPRKPKLKLWHEDSTGDLYLHREHLHENLAWGGSRYPCLVSDCYYQTVSPVGLRTTVFKTSKGLMDHCRRAHELSSKMASTSHLLSQDDIGPGSSWSAATEFADMPAWRHAIDIDFEITFPETPGDPFEAELESWGFDAQQSDPLDTPDAQHFIPWQDTASNSLPPQNMLSSTDRPDSWGLMSYSNGDDNGTSTGSPVNSGTSLTKYQPTKPSTG